MTIRDCLERVRRNGRREEGQTMAEYAVALSVISVAVLAAFSLLSGGVRGALDSFVSALPR